MTSVNDPTAQLSAARPPAEQKLAIGSASLLARPTRHTPLIVVTHRIELYLGNPSVFVLLWKLDLLNNSVTMRSVVQEAVDSASRPIPSLPSDIEMSGLNWWRHDMVLLGR